LFLRHEGYLGAIGAFLKGAEEDSKEKHTHAYINLHLVSTGLLYTCPIRGTKYKYEPESQIIIKCT